jgi:TRAP-type mannitol/chloroaromatic compound transport system permease small subunit
MNGLLAFAHGMDRVSRAFAWVAAWAILIVSLVAAGDALIAYLITYLDEVFVWLAARGVNLMGALDLYRARANAVSDFNMILFALMVMFGAPWTLKVNEHVRVDLLYSALTNRGRAWLDLIGGILFLVPMCVVMIWFTWPWFMEAWTGNEQSINAGGLPRWPSKFMLPLGFVILLLQGLAEIIKCIAELTTGYVREHAYVKPDQ